MAKATPPVTVTPTMDLLSRLRLSCLLSHGYFPAELPPPFTARVFAKNSVNFAHSWDLSRISHSKNWTRAESYNIPKPGHTRRTLSLVNPVNQLLVAYLVSTNWTEIRSRLQGSEITEFQPKINLSLSGRAVTGVDFTRVNRRKIQILSSYGRYVQTDVVRFYRSVYTHAIPWAIKGKAWCKATLHDPAFVGHFSNRLDAAVRAGQEGQTIGLPIGPDTSRILSELIMTDVEHRTKMVMPDLRRRAVRYVDDWIVGLKDEESPAAIISKISSALQDYELELNGEKTFVVGLGGRHTPEWKHFLRTFQVSKNENTQCDDLD